MMILSPEELHTALVPIRRQLAVLHVMLIANLIGVAVLLIQAFL